MNKTIFFAFVAAVCGTVVNPIHAQGTAFTYQGRLNDGANPANGNYDLRFAIYDAASVGTQQGNLLTNSATAVSNGLFTVVLDFGNQFPGAARWLELAVRTNGGGAFATLAPRQQVTPTPYAIFSETAASANAVAGGIVGPGQLATTAAPAAGQVLGFTAGGLAWRDLPNPPPAWSLAGNAATSAGVNFLGTIDNQPLELHVSGYRAFRIEPDPTLTQAANLIGGAANNSVGANSPGNFIGGGSGNSVGGNVYYAAIGGGSGNSLNGTGSTIAGGAHNTVPLGAAYATIGGGEYNTNRSQYGTVPGGYNNLAAGNFSFAAGQQAKAQQTGCFVWADSTPVTYDPFQLAGPQGIQDSFNIRATGGFYLATAVDGGGNITAMLDVLPNGNVGIGTDSPGHLLDVAGRMRVRDGGGTAGIWLNTYFAPYGGGSQDIGFMGVLDSTRIGFFGNDPRGGSGWGLTFDTLTGNVGIGTGSSYPTSKLQVNGDAQVCTLTIAGGCDLSEPFNLASADIPRGSLVVIDETIPGQLRLSDRAYDTRVAGIISGANGINPGISLRQPGINDGGENVALSGRVYALADASYGAIKPGDLLTTSNTPGHCMKVSDQAKAQGAVIGKAMSSLKNGKGMVLVLVSLQ